MYEFESSYWWYRGIHRALIDIVKSLPLVPQAKLLDAGCGTGKNLENLTLEVSKDSFGFDLSRHAAPFWPKRELSKVCLGSINNIPYRSDTFDAVISVDVLECDEVNEIEACTELVRVLKTGGFLILVVPAYEWLKSKEHHKAVHASRRYSRTSLMRLLGNAPVEVLRITHFFASLLPAVAAYRTLQKFSANRSQDAPRSELRPLPSVVNGALFKMVSVERILLRYLDLPFGSSMVAIARKIYKP